MRCAAWHQREAFWSGRLRECSTCNPERSRTSAEQATVCGDAFGTSCYSFAKKNSPGVVCGELVNAFRRQAGPCEVSQFGLNADELLVVWVCPVGNV